MVKFFSNGGSTMWLFLLLIIVIIIMAIKTIVELWVRRRSDASVENGLNAILFWGAISAALGVWGHFSGIYLAMQNILNIKDTSPAIVAEGYLISLANIVTGLLILLISSILWISLRWRYKKLLLKEMTK